MFKGGDDFPFPHFLSILFYGVTLFFSSMNHALSYSCHENVLIEWCRTLAGEPYGIILLCVSSHLGLLFAFI